MSMIRFMLDRVENVKKLYTEDSEIFARVVFSRNFAYVKFREKKTREMAKSFCS